MIKELTISIAAYNVERYLDNLMKSIVETETMEMIEILIINDGSKDNTSMIAAKYQEQYPQSVRLINKENGGHGSTINKGIEEATGRYFRALDGDDWMHSEHLKTFVEKLKHIDSDIILSDYCKCFENGKSERSDEFQGLLDGKKYIFDEIWYPGLWMRYHSVIFRTELLKKHKIRLDEHCFYVDVEYMLYPIPFVTTIYYSKNYLYCYRVGTEGQSVSNTSRMKNIMHSEKVAQSLITYYQKNKENLSREKKQYFIDEISFHCKWHEESLLLFPPRKEVREQIIAFEEYVKDVAPEIYVHMESKSKVIVILRKTGYYTYRLASAYVKEREGNRLAE